MHAPIFLIKLVDRQYLHYVVPVIVGYLDKLYGWIHEPSVEHYMDLHLSGKGVKTKCQNKSSTAREVLGRLMLMWMTWKHLQTD